MTELLTPSEEEIAKMGADAEAVLQQNIEYYLEHGEPDDDDFKLLMKGKKHKQLAYLVSGSMVAGAWGLVKNPLKKNTELAKGTTVGLQGGFKTGIGSLATVKPVSELGKFTGWTVAATVIFGYVHIHMYEHKKPVGVYNGGAAGANLAGAYTWGKFL